jgi:hypothetical protein
VAINDSKQQQQLLHRRVRKHTVNQQEAPKMEQNQQPPHQPEDATTIHTIHPVIMQPQLLLQLLLLIVKVAESLHWPFLRFKKLLLLQLMLRLMSLMQENLVAVSSKQPISPLRKAVDAAAVAVVVMVVGVKPTAKPNYS